MLSKIIQYNYLCSWVSNIQLPQNGISIISDHNTYQKRKPQSLKMLFSHWHEMAKIYKKVTLIDHKN